MNAREDEIRDEPLERLLAKAKGPPARPEFKARLRDEFLAGALEAAPTERSPLRALPPAIPERSRGFPFLWLWVLAASVTFIVYFVVSRESDPKWRVIEAPASGIVVVDGVRVEVGDRTRFIDLLQTARELDTQQSTLRLSMRDEVVLELGPATRLSQVSFPAAGPYSLRTETGSLRVSTGPSFHGNNLRVLTDDMEAHVVGTIFAVDVDEKGTCLCCLQGSVSCDAKDGQGAKPIEASKMCFAYRDRKKPAWGAAYEPHVEPLRALQTWSQLHWK
jgi:hypothetical protein